MQFFNLGLSNDKLPYKNASNQRILGCDSNTPSKHSTFVKLSKYKLLTHTGYQNTNENLATIQLPKRRLAITESQRVILSLRLDFFLLDKFAAMFQNNRIIQYVSLLSGKRLISPHFQGSSNCLTQCLVLLELIYRHARTPTLL